MGPSLSHQIRYSALNHKCVVATGWSIDFKGVTPGAIGGLERLGSWGTICGGGAAMGMGVAGSEICAMAIPLRSNKTPSVEMDFARIRNLPGFTGFHPWTPSWAEFGVPL